ncbi:hypothetical protein R1sor_001353 [Riccia sorocarpa]|uniref:C2H2-type domain-containing protein n=1 Tax=Riccia sorocarpa TaxID=122646 RepID=A0ABD3GXC9_9MARC
MVHITEMRVPLPITVEEFKRGQRYANWKTNEANTTEGQGGQIVSTSPYVSEVYGEGIFTHSLYRLGDRIPDWVTKLVPSSALVIDEKTWMAYPHIRSVLTVPFFHKLKIEMITLHENDDGSTENIHGLSEAELAIRKVDIVDIAMDKVAKRDYQAKLDPQLFKSTKTGVGPLKSGWQNNAETMMCAYKLVRVEANYWGVQNRLEKLMLNGVRQIVLLTHRNALCYLDEWYDLTYQEICEMEAEGRKKLKEAVKQPPIIDPNTGMELVIETDDDFVRTTDESENESEVEFFEATMEWVTQEAEEYGESLITEVSRDASSLLMITATDSCAVCLARSYTSKQAEILCRTCNEYYCQNCFTEFHVTPRLRQHIRQYSTDLNPPTRRPYLCTEPSITSISEERDMEDDSATFQATGIAVAELVAEHSRQPPVARVESETPDQHSPSWLDELNSSFKDIQVSSTPLAKVRSKSSYKILNSLPDYSLENSQEFTQISANSIRSNLHQEVTGRKKLSVRPNELSEEMVRSVSLLYQRYAENQSYSARPSVTSSQCLPYVRRRSRSFSSGIDVQQSEDNLQSLSPDESLHDPYGMRQSWNIGAYSRCVEVTFTPEEDKLKDYEPLYRHFRALVESLQHVDPRDLAHEQRLAFWINVYNSLMMHAYMVRGIPWSHYKRITIMHKSAYIVGGHLFSALAIEHAILRACSYRPALASLLPVQKYKRHDARQAYALDRPEPLISFALCCGSHSAPMVRTYTAKNVRSELQQACRDFLSAHIGFTRHKRVIIPKILQWYARDFSSSAKSLLEWVALQLPEEQRVLVEECLAQKKGKKRLAVVTYNWSFRYLIEKVAPAPNSSS